MKLWNMYETINRRRPGSNRLHFKSASFKSFILVNLIQIEIVFNTLLFSIVINRSFSIFLVFCLFNILVRHSIPLHLINESKGSVSHFVYTCFTKSLPVFSQCCKGPQSSDVPTTGNQFNSLLSRATKVVQWYFLFWRFRKLPRYWKNCIYWILGRSCMTTKLAWDYAKGSLDLEDQIISRLRSKFRNY